MEVTVERIYDEPGEDGARVLVDRLWPRGVSKEAADLDDRIRTIAPSYAKTSACSRKVVRSSFASCSRSRV